MPKIDFDQYEKAKAIEGDGGLQKLQAGGYVATITAVRTEWEDSFGREWTSDEKEYVKLIFDITEGEQANIFADDKYLDPEFDWAHWACLSWKGVNDDTRRMGMLKGIMTAFNESNAGFDAFAAFQADKWDLFIGKQIGFIIGEEEYENREGEVAIKTTLPKFRSVSTIREGKFSVPKLKKLKRDDADVSTLTRTVQPAGAYDGELPF